MRDIDWTFLGFIGSLFLMMALLMGLLIWSGQDFANRCERAAGVLVSYNVCLTKDSTVLMVKS